MQMQSPIIRFERPVTFVGGGDVSLATYTFCTGIGRDVIAVDGAARFVLDQGHVPAAVLGDFDSLDDSTRSELPSDVLHHVAEQDTTDFDKALRSIEAPLILAAGFLGKRVDHELAALNVLVRHAHKRCVLVGEVSSIAVVPSDLHLELPEKTDFSLFPMGEVYGVSEGLEWPIEGLQFAPDAQIGTSNRISGPVSLSMDGPRMLAIVPKERTAALIKGLRAAPLWPAPSL